MKYICQTVIGKMIFYLRVLTSYKCNTWLISVLDKGIRRQLEAQRDIYS